jgi:hypothetical protein
MVHIYRKWQNSLLLIKGQHSYFNNFMEQCMAIGLPREQSNQFEAVILTAAIYPAFNAFDSCIL